MCKDQERIDAKKEAIRGLTRARSAWDSQLLEILEQLDRIKRTYEAARSYHGAYRHDAAHSLLGVAAGEVQLLEEATASIDEKHGEIVKRLHDLDEMRRANVSGKARF